MIQNEILEHVEKLAQLVEGLEAETKTKKRGVEKQPVLGFIAKLLLPMCFSSLEALAEQIKDEAAKGLAVLAIETLSELVAILTDNEKTDKLAAIEAWLNETAADKEIKLLALVKILLLRGRDGNKKTSLLNMLTRISDLIK